jgi:phage terminase Nu1 subunit (DNA packaging protein)
MSQKELAECLRVSVRTVERWRKAGEPMPKARRYPSGRLYWLSGEVEAWMRLRRRQIATNPDI